MSDKTASFYGGKKENGQWVFYHLFKTENGDLLQRQNGSWWTALLCSEELRTQEMAGKRGPSRF
jgi:hypothetical protein